MVADAEDVPPITASPIPNCHWLLQFLTAEIYPSSLIQTFPKKDAAHNRARRCRARLRGKLLEGRRHLRHLTKRWMQCYSPALARARPHLWDEPGVCRLDRRYHNGDRMVGRSRDEHSGGSYAKIDRRCRHERGRPR